MTEFRTALRKVRLKNGAEISVIRPNNAHNIAQQMHSLALEIEQGIMPADTVVTVVSSGPTMRHWHWGAYDRARNAGLLLSAANQLARHSEK